MCKKNVFLVFKPNQIQTCSRTPATTLYTIIHLIATRKEEKIPGSGGRRWDDGGRGRGIGRREHGTGSGGVSVNFEYKLWKYKLQKF